MTSVVPTDAVASKAAAHPRSPQATPTPFGFEHHASLRSRPVCSSCRSRELFGISQLLPEQCPTECVPYSPCAPYPTGIIAPCDACGRWIDVPDRFARTRGTACAGAPLTCSSSEVVLLDNGFAQPQVMARVCPSASDGP